MFGRQRGATFLGMVIILAIVGSAVYAGIRLTPLYFEYMAVARALDQTAKEYQGEPTSPQALRTSLDRRWTIEDIKSLDPKEIDIKKTGNGFTMRAEYRAEAPFAGNVSLVVDFDKTVLVSQGGGAGDGT
jgi:hypothetical protein